MIKPSDFVNFFRESGVQFFTGVPDSLLGGLGANLSMNFSVNEHLISANEGTAVATAIGSFLRTGRVPVVYLQNSGTGNAINPLLSLADSEVMGIPLVLVIGWRGEPGETDEPQHAKQGRVMTSMLDGMEIPWKVLPHDPQGAELVCHEAVSTALARRGPQVVLVRANTIEKVGFEDATSDARFPSREAALKETLEHLGSEPLIVSTTGMLSRELFELRKQSNADSDRDVLTVGGMGHASSIALGIAIKSPDDEVWCLDGDGALIMHLGALAIIGNVAPKNYFHIVFNNEAHDSVGGQPTSSGTMDIPKLAAAVGYRWSSKVLTTEAIQPQIKEMRAAGGPAILEIRVRKGARPTLGRPITSPYESITRFVKSSSDQNRHEK